MLGINKPKDGFPAKKHGDFLNFPRNGHNFWIAKVGSPTIRWISFDLPKNMKKSMHTKCWIDKLSISSKISVGKKYSPQNLSGSHHLDIFGIHHRLFHPWCLTKVPAWGWWGWATGLYAFPWSFRGIPYLFGGKVPTWTKSLKLVVEQFHSHWTVRLSTSWQKHPEYRFPWNCEGGFPTL